MTRDEHTKIVQQILPLVGADNQAKASDLLTQLSEDYEKTLTEHEAAAKQVETLTANNETLRDVNAKLFLKVGQVDTPAPTNPDKPEGDKPEEDTPTFESLFNEKGELM